jgi:hypothetical protein
MTKPAALSDEMRSRVAAVLAILAGVGADQAEAAAVATAPAPAPAPGKRPRGRRKTDMLGRTCGQWLVIAEAPSFKFVGPTGKRSTQAQWRVRCGGCGTKATVRGVTLRVGGSKSCRPCASRKSSAARVATMRAAHESEKPIVP